MLVEQPTCVANQAVDVMLLLQSTRGSQPLEVVPHGRFAKIVVLPTKPNLAMILKVSAACSRAW